VSGKLSVTESGRNGRVLQTLRRVWSHLTRYTARWAYLLAAVCVIIYALVPDEWEISDPVKQFVLILSSVAVGAVVLPELPSNLWTIDVEKVRNLIPGAQRTSLARSLIEAESEDQRWNELVWLKALDPLLEASRKPWQYVRDMDYDVSVHLGRTLQLGDERIPVHSVSVDHKSSRVLARPGIDAVWLSIARTGSALQSEFGEAACLAREIVPLGTLTGQAWQNATVAACHAELYVDGDRVELIHEVTPERPDLVRWRTPVEFELPTERVRVRVQFDFHLDPSVDTFPVIFSGYYCAGTTDIALRLYDENSPSELECDYYVGRALDESGHQGISQYNNGVYRQFAFSTGRDGILWPGSGVMFRWKPKP
jgi:hypothetical protein